MKIKIAELHQHCTDLVTGMRVMLTHVCIDLGGIRYYIAVPDGQNPKTMGPAESLVMSPTRLTDIKHTETIDVPTELIHTRVRDRASGIKGVVAQLIVHPQGCVHAAITPDGLTETHGIPEYFEADIRRLDSPLLKAMTKAEKKASEKKKPSPCTGLPRLTCPSTATPHL